MNNSYKFLKKKEEENNSFTTNFTVLLSNIPFQLDNNFQDCVHNNSELEQKEFENFFFKDEFNINNISNPFMTPNNSFIFQSEEEKGNFKKENINNVKFIVKKKIFNIEKKKKLGRLKKCSNKMGKHDKSNIDNIIRKFKVFLTKNIYNYLNDSFEVNKNKKLDKRVKVIKYIASRFTKSVKRNFNLNWLNTKVKDYFSNVVSSRFFTLDNQYNKNLIKKIYKIGKEKKAIEILDKSINDFHQIYINDDKENKYIGFKTIKDDIKKLREKGETEEYIEKYKYVSENIKKIFTDIHPRNRKRKMKNN